jgi:lysophospholipase L1-like esterase
MKLTKYISLLGIAIIFWHCEPSFDEFKPSNGDADFSTFVAIGDSYSAGYTDGALGDSSQLFSFPNLIANQLKLVGMVGDFKQPLTPEKMSIGTTVLDANGTLNGYFKLRVVEKELLPVPTIGNPEVFSTLIGNQAPFNNVAVPGAKSFHLLAPGFGNPANGAGNYNPFFTRFASSLQSSSVVGDALLCQPTFFSLWIGGNDVLTYALAGGKRDAITNSAYFEGVVNQIVTSLMNSAPKGVVANVPNINALPYFTHIINSLGYKPYVVKDASGSIRTLVEGELILLSASSYLKAGFGQSIDKPISDEFVLDLNEINAINTATEAYNASLKKIAQEKDLAFVDLNEVMNGIINGKMIDGTKYTTAFVSGNVFSLDGIHATARGSAIIANEFIRAINLKYKSQIPLVNVNNYQTVIFP